MRRFILSFITAQYTRGLSNEKGGARRPRPLCVVYSHSVRLTAIPAVSGFACEHPCDIVGRIDTLPRRLPELLKLLWRYCCLLHYWRMPVEVVRVEIPVEVPVLDRVLKDLRPRERHHIVERAVRRPRVHKPLAHQEGGLHLLFRLVREANHHIYRAGDAESHGDAHQLDHIDVVVVQLPCCVLLEDALAGALDGKDDERQSGVSKERKI